MTLSWCQPYLLGQVPAQPSGESWRGGGEAATAPGTGSSVRVSMLGSKHLSDGLSAPSSPTPAALHWPQDECQGFPGALPVSLLCSSTHPLPRPLAPVLNPVLCYSLQQQSSALWLACPCLQDTVQGAPAWPGMARCTATLAYIVFLGAGRLLPAVLPADKAGSHSVQAEGCQQCMLVAC